MTGCCDSDTNVGFQCRQVERCSKMFHAGCLCLNTQNSVPDAARDMSQTEKGKIFIHSGTRFLAYKERCDSVMLSHQFTKMPLFMYFDCQ